MLPKQNRMRTADQFGQVMHKGSRAGNDLMVVHYLAGQSEQDFPLVGFIVSKRALPHAVDRNRIKRQLREIIRRKLDEFPQGSQIVVRVLRAVKGKDSAHLEKAFDNGMRRAIRKSVSQCGTPESNVNPAQSRSKK